MLKPRRTHLSGFKVRTITIQGDAKSFGFKTQRSKGPSRLGECNQEPLESYKGGPFGSGEESAKK